MRFNAIVVAGGRSSRLGGTPKALLSDGHQTLLDSTLAAVEGAHTRVVVGPEDLPVPSATILTREDPPFSGPAAAIAAGLSALPTDSAEWTLLLAVDMPAAAESVRQLLDAASHAAHEVNGFAAEAESVFQPLVGIYRTASLKEAFAAATPNSSVRRYLKQLDPEIVQLSASACQDVDTWDAAHRTGFVRPTDPHHASSTGHRLQHSTWYEAVSAAYLAGQGLRETGRMQSTEVPLTEALGLTLASDLACPIDLPHYDSSAMDGYAVAGAPPWVLLEREETEEHENIHRRARQLTPGQCTPILTGGLIPPGCEAILRQEHAQVQGAPGERTVSPTQASPSPGADIRRAGEEMPAGTVVAHAGDTLTPRLAAFVAVCGFDTVPVMPRVPVAVAYTGNEVITSGVPGPGQVRDAFSVQFPAIVSAMGGSVVATGRLHDDAAELHRFLGSHLDAAVVMITGGSSTSEVDMVRTVLRELGARYVFESVRVRPGHPCLCAVLPDVRLVLGLPGNPLAAHTSLYSYLPAIIAGARGQAQPTPRTARAGEPVASFRREDLRLIPAVFDEGQIVPVAGKHHSHMLFAFARAEALMIVPPHGVTTGEGIEYLPLAV